MSPSDSEKIGHQKASKWKSAAKGIRYREHPSRKHGKKLYSDLSPKWQAD